MTNQEITSSQIRKLSEEAAAHGDLEMVAICGRALDGSMADRRECERVVREARARAEG